MWFGIYRPGKKNWQASAPRILLLPDTQGEWQVVDSLDPESDGEEYSRPSFAHETSAR